MKWGDQMERLTSTHLKMRGELKGFEGGEERFGEGIEGFEAEGRGGGVSVAHFSDTRKCCDYGEL